MKSMPSGWSVCARK